MRGCAVGVSVARYYDPTTAQFLTRDPIEPITQQPYQYANGDPLDQIDPLGLCGWTDPLGCAADAAGWVEDNSGTLSTIASGVATVAYAACPFTDGLGCAVGLAASATSTGLAAVATYDACVNGNGNCTSAAISLGASALATGVSAYANGAMKAAVAEWRNGYGVDVRLELRKSVAGAWTNLFSEIAGAGTTWWC